VEGGRNILEGFIGVYSRSSLFQRGAAVKKTVLSLFAVLLLSGCGNKQSKYPIKIGLSMDTLRAARWAVDRDVFTAECNKRGVGVLVRPRTS
jgi:ABC-type xylose transport system substrate-binding protein